VRCLQSTSPSTPIVGAQFDLIFDNSLATVTSVTEGKLLNQDGIYVVTFEVTDGYISDSEDITITVNDANHAPIITTFVPENSLTFNESDVITIGIIATDADGQALSYTIKIDGATKNTSSSYAWETDYSSAGTHTIDITVSDGIVQVTDQRTITINDVHPRWDVNEDGTVNVLDISIIGQKYGTSVEAPYPRWDVNQDGVKSRINFCSEFFRRGDIAVKVVGVVGFLMGVHKQEGYGHEMIELLYVVHPLVTKA
jgi:hypothetical protein